jgi:hypothetical protein
MPEKDPTNYSFVTYGWVMLLSAWGGLVSFLRKQKAGKVRAFNITEFLGELMTSALAGLITFWLCEWSNTSPLLSAALIAISGHMGSRALFQFESWAESKFGLAEKR